MVSGPPAVVCLKNHVFNQCSSSVVVATCSLVGPSARPIILLSLRLYLVTEDSVDTFSSLSLSLISIDNVFVLFFTTLL